MKTHLTKACDHDENKWCLHCEEGCESCGVLEAGDDGYCAECSFERSIMAAEAFYEGDR